MPKKVIPIIVLIVVFIFSSIFSLPITILLGNFSDFDYIDESHSFYYTPSNSSSFENLNINVDTANIEILYVEPQSPYYVKIDVNIKFGGSNMKGKSSLDYLNIIWHNLSSTENFTLIMLYNI